MTASEVPATQQENQPDFERGNFPGVSWCLSHRQFDWQSIVKGYTHQSKANRRTGHQVWSARRGQERGLCGHREPPQLHLLLLLWKAKIEASLPNSTGTGTTHKCQPEGEVQAQQMRVFLIPQSWGCARFQRVVIGCSCPQPRRQREDWQLRLDSQGRVCLSLVPYCPLMVCMSGAACLPACVPLCVCVCCFCNLRIFPRILKYQTFQLHSERTAKSTIPGI